MNMELELVKIQMKKIRNRGYKQVELGEIESGLMQVQKNRNRGGRLEEFVGEKLGKKFHQQIRRRECKLVEKLETN